MNFSDAFSDCESVYYSCAEDDDNGDEELDARPPPFFLGSTSTSAFSYSDSRILRQLACIHAAKILLAEITREGRDPTSLTPFEGDGLLSWIFSGCSGWSSSTDEEFATLLNSPIVRSTLEVANSETRPCSMDKIGAFIRQLNEESPAAVLCGQNDALTIVRLKSPKGGSYVVFNPQCRASLEMKNASLRYFPTLDDATLHVYNIMAIYRGAESRFPAHMYEGYILVPSASFAQITVVVMYQVQMREKEKSLKAKQASPPGMKVTLNGPVQEEPGKETESTASLGSKSGKKIFKGDMDEMEALAAAIMESSRSLIGRMEGSDQESTSHGSTSASDGANSSDSQPSRLSPKRNGTPPWFGHPPMASTSSGHMRGAATIEDLPGADKPPSYDNVSRVVTGQSLDSDIQEALRLQADFDDDEASLALAIKLSLEEDERARQEAASSVPVPVLAPAPPSPPPVLVTKGPTCPICGGECEESRMERVSICGHATCRICLRQYVGGRIRAAGLKGRGTIMCPVCQPDQENRGIVLQTVAELIG